MDTPKAPPPAAAAEPNSDSVTSAGVARGAFISTAYVGRQVKAYAVFETEVESLSTFNAQATVCFSIGSALLAFAVGIWTNAAFVDKAPPEGAILAKVIAPGLIIGALIGYWLGYINLRKRKTLLDTIATESKAP